MLLRSLETRIAKIEEAQRQHLNSKYKHVRDMEGNLDIIFANDKKYHFPIFPFRPYQLEIQEELFLKGRRYFYFWWPRRHGKEVITWNLILQAALTQPGNYYIIYPNNVRARMVLWDGDISFPDGTSIRFRDMIPPQFVKRMNEAEMKITLTNKSTIRCLGSDIDPEKLRGINAKGIVVSEFAYCDPRVVQVLTPITRQNKGWMMLQTTPSGMNHATKKMKELVDNKEWFTRIETIKTLLDKDGNQFVTDDDIEKERDAKIPEWFIQQEYFCNVNADTEIFYFSKEMNYILDPKNEIIKKHLWMSGKVVYVFFDIGINDTCAMTLVQFMGKRPVIIYYYERNNQSLEHYIDVAEKFAAPKNLRIKKYFNPHDGDNRNWGSGKSAVDYGADLGIEMESVKKPQSHATAIQGMRRLLPSCFFDEEVARLIDCLSNYQKEFDEENNVYKSTPLHNWASHGVKSFQTLMLAMEADLIVDDQQNISYYNQNL